MSFLFVLSTAIILLFVLFTLYYYIAGKKEVPHHQLLEEEFEKKNDALYIRCHFFAKIVTVNVFLTKNVIFLNLVQK